MTKFLILSLAVLLWSCTGSLEDGSPVRLVVSLNPSSSGNITCKGNVLNLDKLPSLVLLDITRFTGSTSSNPCGTITPLSGAAFQMINGAETSVPSVFVSIPSQSTVQRFLFQNTAANSNTLVQQALQYKPSDNSVFCPTQLAVTQDNLKLAVLDDPKRGGCPTLPVRDPRVLIFDLSKSTLSFQSIDLKRFDFSSGDISMTVFSNRLYVLGAFAGAYQVARFDLNAPDPSVNPVTSGSFNFAPTDTSVKLNVAQNRVLASFSSNLNGLVVPILEDATQTPPIRFGDELKTGAAATDQAIGKTNLIRSNSSFTLFLRPENVLFQQATNFGVASLNTALDATFPPDNSIWVLNANRLQKADTRNFPTDKPQFDSGIDLTGLNPSNVVWTFDENFN